MTPALEPAKATLDPWFDQLVATLRAHQLQLETKTASSIIEEAYAIFLSGSYDQQFRFSKELAQRHFVSKILLDYTQLFADKRPRQLAVDFNDSEVLVWAEINDDDEAMERFLILAEAEINARYYQYGFAMTTMVVEVSDALSVPNHYQVLIG